MFKAWFFISNFTFIKYLTLRLNQLHVNHKSHIFQPTITKHHTKVLKTLKFLCACDYLKVHDSHTQLHLCINFSSTTAL